MHSTSETERILVIYVPRTRKFVKIGSNLISFQPSLALYRSLGVLRDKNEWVYYS